jgi:uncharacterized delta-60 repeat protein
VPDYQRAAKKKRIAALPWQARRATTIPRRFAGNATKPKKTMLRAIYYPNYLLPVCLLCISLRSQGATPSLLWTKNYATPVEEKINKAVLDSAGNIYLTGYTHESTYQECLTMKLNSNGTAAWTNRFGGPGFAAGVANDIAVDPGGNAYITGTMSTYGTTPGCMFLTIKYAPEGTPIWTNTYPNEGVDSANAIALALDSSTNVIVIGRFYDSGLGAYALAALKYSADGVSIWTNVLQDSTANNYPVGIAVDKADNIFVTGTSQPFSSINNDLLTLKYTYSGSLVWSNRYTGLFAGSCNAAAIALDSLGNAIVTGSSSLSGTVAFAIVKYTPDGGQLWAVRHSGVSGGANFPYALAIDSSNNVYVTGQAGRGTVNADYMTVKYSAGGVVQWDRRYDSAGFNSDYAAAIAVDSLGNAYVTGSVYAGSGNAAQQDIVTIKYATNGSGVWTNRQSARANGEEVGIAALVLSPGELVIAANVANAESSDPSADDWAFFRLSESSVPPQGNLVCTISTNRSAMLQCSGSPWLSYVIQRTSDLQSGPWQAVSTNRLGTNTKFTFVDSNPQQPHAFYRLQQE